jgi:methionyl-tRNA synthetase
MSSRYLVTPALPYANGPAHIGHMVEQVQVNIFVRALRMAGEDVLYVCGADSHGTPIEINAGKAGVAPETFAARWQHSHEESFKRFFVEFDGGYGTTHTPENEAHAGRIFEALKAADHIRVRDVEQLFDPESERFLPDRMVKGTCPKCDSEDQYGDSCEVCGSTYNPTDLKNPKSALSGATPVMKSSTHYFFELGNYADRLKDYLKRPGVLSPDVQRFLDRWFNEGLRDWDISREGPYFGFKIPGEDNKYFYVWLDAPIGYISLSERAAQARGRSFDDYWKDPNTRIVHFLGKDIVYFHTLFWPAMLMAAGYTLPETIAVHGMLTVDGVKMSKSRGTFIMADTWADHLDPQTLRYYLACKLGPGVEDIDLNLEDFKNRVNADLVNKVVNLVSRTVPMLHRNHEGEVGPTDPDAVDMLDEVRRSAEKVEALYRSRDNARVVREVVAMADLGNRYLQENAPWNTVKEDPEKAKMQLTTALWVGKACVGLLKPILPWVAEQAEAMFGMDDPGFTFANILDPLKPGSQVGAYPRLFERVDAKKIAAMVEASKEGKKDSDKKKNKADQKTAKKEAKSDAKSAKKGGGKDKDGFIAFDQFMDVDLRAAKVVEAGLVEGADKLLSLKLDVGPLGSRHVFAGLRAHYSPEDLLGKMVVLVANLKPRKMRFGVSEGMVLAAGDENPVVLEAANANPGDRVS